MRKIAYGLGGLVLVALALFLHWSLPSRDVVRIVNTEVARAGVEVRGAEGDRLPATRDVRYISAVQPDGDAIVYRNEDTGWGWPPYFKFDSADLAARADDLRSTRDDPQWVLVTHYGWRLPLFSMFENAVSVRPAAGPDDKPLPWFNLIVLALLAGLFLFVWTRLRRWRR